jgi:nucleoid-associated protein YgaU
MINVSVYALTSRCPLLSVSGNLEFSIRVPLSQQRRSDDTFYVVQTRDNLMKLAYQFYNDIRLWWVLYDANADLITAHPLELPVGLTLRVPSQQTVETEVLNGATV